MDTWTTNRTILSTSRAFTHTSPVWSFRPSAAPWPGGSSGGRGAAQVLEDYDEPYPGAGSGVRRGLQVIVTAYASARLKTEAERMLKSLDE